MAVSTESIQRWGEGGHGIPTSLQEFLDDRGMGSVQPRPAVDLAQVAVRASRIATDELGALTGVHDDLTRLRCSGGFSFIDLCNRRWPGREVPVVDVVVLPGSHEEVRAILDLAAAKQWAVVPFGGGTSVVDGVDVTDRLSVGVAFWHMNMVRHLDPESGEGAGSSGHHRPGT